MELTKIQDLWYDNEIKEFREEYAGKSLELARVLANGLTVSGFKVLIITLHSDDAANPLICTRNFLKGTVEYNKDYTIIRCNDFIVDCLSTDDLMTPNAYVQILSQLNKSIAIKSLYNQGIGEIALYGDKRVFLYRQPPQSNS